MRPGRVLAIGGIAVAVGAFGWFAASLFVPFAQADARLEYLLVGAPLSVFLASTAAAAAVLWILVHRLNVSVRAVAPLACLGVAPLAAVNLLPVAGGYLSVLTHVLVDLRWWWAGLVVALVALRIDRDAGSPVRRRLTAWRLPLSRRQFALDGALFLVVLSSAIVTNTYLRFTAVLHGDEVKYLRYCENFYQGLGLEVEHQRTIDELTPAYSPPIGRNFTLARSAFRQELSNVATDVRAFVRDPLTFRWNRARYAEEWFIRGKNGDLYQVHNPGLALVLFPAYYLDRRFSSGTPGYQGRIPGRLPVTNSVCLLIWAVWSVVVFRFLRHAIESDALRWLLSATAMLTMPVAAFPFQIYPEAVAGLILFGVGGVLLRGRAGRRAALALGLAAGFLPWLHVRYLVLAAVLFAWGLWSLRGRRVPFVTAFLVLLAGMSVYAYHLTGSFMPDAMYGTQGSYSPWRVRDALQAAAAYPFDRIWGLFAHTPLYLFALPGIVVAARRQPRTMLLSTLLFVGLAGPSSGHGFSAAGATPLRHLVAVIPFLMLPVAHTLMVWGRQRWVRAVFLVALVLSLDTGISYNLHHTKDVGRFVDWGRSGWETNLLMPWTHAAPWDQWRSNFALFLVWLTASVVLLILPLLTRRALRTAVDPALPSGGGAVVSSGEPAMVSLPYALAVVGVFAAFATAATALGREWTRTDYFIPAVEARIATIRYVEPMERCALCYSSVRGELGRGALVGNTIESFSIFTSRRVRSGDEERLEPYAGAFEPGAPIVFTARVAAREGAGWGTLAIDFGDGEASTVPNLFGHSDISHAYARPGVYSVIATFATAQGILIKRELQILVGSGVQ